MRTIAFLSQAPWLRRDRVIAWAAILLACEAALFCFIAAWKWGWVVPGVPVQSSDFVSFVAAGRLALAGTPALAYDQGAHHLAQQAILSAHAPYQFFFYPPVFLLPCAALALLPYGIAYAVFQCGTLWLFLAAMRRILGRYGAGWAWLVPILAFPPVFWNIGVGQNAFLTAALFAGFTLLLPARPGSAGVLLGMMCYKPHFGLLAPFALAAGGHWRAFAAAGTAVAGLIWITLALFGTDTWAAYIAAAAGSTGVYESGRIDLAGMITPFGALRLNGVAASAAWGVQILAMVVAVGLVAALWRSRASYPVRVAVLLAATLLAAPLALLYDQLLLLVAIGWLVRAASETGFLPWERLGLALAWPLSLLTWPVATDLHVPLAPATHLLVLGLALHRAGWLRLPRAVSVQPVGATP